jgi:iron complex outermembrane receptor protein
MMRASIDRVPLGKPETPPILRTMMKFGLPERSRETGATARRGRRNATTLAIAATACAWPFALVAQTAPGDADARLARVVVTATRTELAPFDVPASIDRIGAETIRDGRLQVNISESLGGVPGLLARDRQNYAQDVQISVRGFGARSTFGIRGVRLYVDGIPATLPDGQGQITNVDLGSAERIEVLRGPFSALYGNSAGGVIQVFTEEGSGAPSAGVSLAAGSYDTRRVAAKASGAIGGFGYVVSGSVFGTDGYREHSEAERRIGNVKLNWRPDDASKWTFVVNSVALPKAQDPLGLTRAQYDADPRGVDPSATMFDTRKTVDQTQLGLVYERRLDGVNAVRALAYDGHRNTEQFQAIPVGPQASPLHPGGVIELGRDYRGGDLRWTAKTALADAPFTIVAGLSYDALAERRRGFQNFIGPTLGVQGALRRDETNDVWNFDQYLQASWQVAPRWTLHGGLRHSDVRFSSEDHYIVGPNPNDSGSLSFGATLPVVGVMFAASDDVHLYATAGRGFETPTLNELAYRPSGATGLNLGLGAATSNSYEAGVKTRSPWGELNLALFETHTDNEIATLSNVGGRSTFQNVGATRRRGLEAGWSRELRENLRAQAAYTWLDATYRDTFLTCTVTPCAAPNLTIPAGNSIPGLARQQVYTALAWAPPLGWRGGVEVRALSRVFVNDVNSDAAAGFAVAGANLGYLARFGKVDVSGFARVDNLFSRRYAGSVIVNEGNARYFEPAPTRNWTVGVAATAGF